MYFWTWQTEEVLAMLEWMRAFNQGPGDHPVLSFTAFDMQTYSVAATRVTAFARQHAAVGGDLAATVEAAYRGLNALPGNARPDPAFRPAAEQAHKVTALLESRREALVKAAGAAAFRDALQMARTVEQATTLLSSIVTAWSYDHLNLVAIAARGQGHFDEAEAAYWQAIDVDFGKPAAFYNLALLHGDYRAPVASDLDRASAEYRLAIMFLDRAATCATGALHREIEEQLAIMKKTLAQVGAFQARSP